jgi:hypothetical protein
MAVFNNVDLSLDIKAQDRLRQWFSQRGTGKNVVFTAVALGDSDVDYGMSQQISRIKVLNAPFNVPKIKHRLIYSGSQSNISGSISVFTRLVNSNGIVSSRYQFPTNSNFAQGQIPPTLINGLSVDSIFFDPSIVTKMGFIVYFQTLPTGYLDPNGIQERLKQNYTYTTNNIPTGWEILIAMNIQPGQQFQNGSLFIAKPDSYSFNGSQSSITITGTTSGITTTIFYNT